MSARRAILKRGAWATPLLAGTAVPAAAKYGPVTAEAVVDLTGTVSMSHQQWGRAGSVTLSPSSCPTSARPRPLHGSRHRRPSRQDHSAEARRDATNQGSPHDLCARARQIGRIVNIVAWRREMVCSRPCSHRNRERAAGVTGRSRPWRVSPPGSGSRRRSWRHADHRSIARLSRETGKSLILLARPSVSRFLICVPVRFRGRAANRASPCSCGLSCSGAQTVR